MPNHVTNIIQAPREVLESLVRAYTTEEIEEHNDIERKRVERGRERGYEFPLQLLDEDSRTIDFGLVAAIPEDDDPRITATKTEYGGGMVGWSMDGVSPMDFARRIWGTKWNAYSQMIDFEAGALRFDTAWSHPAPVIEALSRLHPDALIEVQYADEDLGSNLGEYSIQNGEIVQETIRHTSDENLSFALRVKYDQSLEDYQAERLQDDLDLARSVIFARLLESVRGLELNDGWKVVREENLDIPQEILDITQTREQIEGIHEDDKLATIVAKFVEEIGDRYIKALPASS